MRVITGTARGKKLKTLDGTDVRPTTDRVKEALFSIIHFNIEGSHILDLFSGSGQLGIEALSRGASYCTFVDQSRDSIDVTRENLSYTKLIGHARIVNMNSLEFLKTTKSNFDIALLDPPYNKGILSDVLPVLEGHINENGIVICEHETSLQLEEKIGRLTLFKEYRYGKVALSLYHA